MCICIDCKWVTSCKAYHFVEKKHQQPHMSETPTFLPREGSPTIEVNIRTESKRKDGVGDATNGDSNDGDDDVVARMWKNQKGQGQQQQQQRNASGDARAKETATTPGVASGGTAIESVVTNTTTTIEYDVVKCADFVLDKACWVRNMPDEIRRLNPDFVPT